MPEGLKNVGPTFCKIMKAILKDQIYRNVFTYVDDIVVMRKKKNTQMKDLAETFTNMRGAQLKLNLEKCVFGVHRGKVLGCLVSVKGINVNPNKIKAIMNKKPL
jgi:transposase